MDYFENAVRNETDESYVYDDGIVKGFLTIGACRDENKANSFELWGIYVDPLMKNQGIGTEMVRFCEEEAARRGFRDIYPRLFKSNHRLPLKVS
jgi:putative acetyltransferase